MPSLVHRAFRLDSGGDDVSSTSGMNSQAGSKVWGNSVLSANFEAPIDNEDENDIMRVASLNTLRLFFE